jgi:HK97 family phage prohead protease
MAIKSLDFRIDTKALDDSGSFEGYAAIFNNVDNGMDVIQPGAFKEIVTTRDGMVRVLHYHRPAEPIGKAEVKEDDKGLRFKGQLILDDPLGKRVHSHMKAGILDGMSIGYDVLPGGADILASGVRALKALKLWEISVVTFGMNPLALVEGVKAEQICNIRDYEDFLRDVGGFSKTHAKALASGGWKALQGQREAAGATLDVTRIANAFTLKI